MAQAPGSPAEAEEPPREALALELYIAGDNLYSRRARANLEALLPALGRPATVRVIDVLADPRAALARRIFATPCLVVVAGDRSQMVIGDLNDRAAVCELLASI